MAALKQHDRFAKFDEDAQWDDFGTGTQEAASVFGAKHSAQTAKGGKSISPPALSVDPIEEPIFPVPQTPPRMKPRPSQQQQQQQGQGTQPAGVSAATSSPIKPGQQPLLSPNTMKKRCALAGCTNDRFARGYCALHLSEVAAKGGHISGPAPTPCSGRRNVHNLWSKEIKQDKETGNTECTWRIIHNDDAHTIVLLDNTFLALRIVSINGKEVFRGQPDMGPWKLDATIGHSFKTAVNVKVVVVPNTKGYEYECLIDDVRFDEAHQIFLSKLSGASVMQRIAQSEANGTPAIEKFKRDQLKENEYVKQNWHLATDEEKTTMAGVKSKVKWEFTIRGAKHAIDLEYGSLSGKKKVSLDGEVICEKKPSVLSANKHKRFSHKFFVDGVECEVTAAKNKANTPDPNNPTAPPRPFLFNLFIDSVPFEDCLLTEADLAGGNLELDLLLKSASLTPSSPGGANRPDGVKGVRRNSVHQTLTSAEYEKQLQEENARERKREHEAKRSKKASGKNGSQINSDSESEDEDD